MLSFSSQKGFFIAAVLLVALELGVQLWASWGIPKARVVERIHYAFPNPGETGFELLNFDAVDGSDLLTPDRGGVGRFRPSESNMTMDVLYLEHDAGNERYLDDLYGHQPERCMTNAGGTLTQNLGIREFSFERQTLRIRCLQFAEPPSGTPIYIYKLIWVPPGFDAEADSTWAARKKIWIRRALTRLPWPPSRLILAGVRGGTEGDAWEFFQTTILENLEMKRTEDL